MKFGVCTDPNHASTLHDAGFDYLELHVQRDLVPDQPAQAFAPLSDRIRALALPAPVANCFLPGALKITGEDVDWRAVEEYVRTACGRAAEVGIEQIVFGSGGARAIPAGFDPTHANDQLVQFGRLVGSLAREEGCMIVVEPLSYDECNVLNTVAESAQYVQDVGDANVRLLVDAFHWARNNEPASSIIDAAPLLVHAHIATTTNRLAPGAEPCAEFEPFFSALQQIGYAGRLSIEARWEITSEAADCALTALRDRSSSTNPPVSGAAHSRV